MEMFKVRIGERIKVYKSYALVLITPNNKNAWLNQNSNSTPVEINNFE